MKHHARPSQEVDNTFQWNMYIGIEYYLKDWATGNIRSHFISDDRKEDNTEDNVIEGKNLEKTEK